jgi:hypothetical protein
MNKRNLGIFRIPTADILNNTDEIAEIFSVLKLIPVKVEHRIDFGVYEYLAICNKFEELPRYSITPEYNLKVVRNKQGNIGNIEVEKI